MKKLVVLTGAGISAESGIKTFRDSNGLWENHDIMEVASPEGWRKNKQLVLDFYNLRRKDAAAAQPNAAHLALAALEKDFDVTIITQNVDDLHERAGSTKVLHLHGQLNLMRSTVDPSIILPYTEDIKVGDKCEKGSQLRPHIVWFGEDVPNIYTAQCESYDSDIFVVIGTSLEVYPASGLLGKVKREATKFIIDPNIPAVNSIENLVKIKKKATEGMVNLTKKLQKLK